VLLLAEQKLWQYKQVFQNKKENELLQITNKQI
jgi:hypothetical protein